MADFVSPGISSAYGYPQTVVNRIKPGKRPASSKSCAIMTDAIGNVVFVADGTGGSYMPGASAIVAIKTLWRNQHIKTAIDFPRIHHQLFPNLISYEHDFPKVRRVNKIEFNV